MEHAIFSRRFTRSNQGEGDMLASGTHWMATWGLSLLCVVPAYAQSQQESTRSFNGMPSDMLIKVHSLGKILQQGLSEGTLTEDEISRSLMSGQLSERLKQLHPEAEQLLYDISEASRQGKGPGEESLLPLFGGLGIPPE
jgi:hypothetical protein